MTARAAPQQTPEATELGIGQDIEPDMPFKVWALPSRQNTGTGLEIKGTSAVIVWSPRDQNPSRRHLAPAGHGHQRPVPAAPVDMAYFGLGGHYEAHDLATYLSGATAWDPPGILSSTTSSPTP